MCGTPNYLAPEVVMEGVRITGYDQLVDSWSVGVIVFSMCASFSVFDSDQTLMYTDSHRIYQVDEHWSIYRGRKRTRYTTSHCRAPDQLGHTPRAGHQHNRYVIPSLNLSSFVEVDLWKSLTAQEFIRRLLEVNPVTRMSLTEARHHPWLSPSAPSASDDSAPERETAQRGLDRKLSDVSELSELPEDDEHVGMNGDASMLSAAPSADVMLGVHSLQIDSSQRMRPLPLERRSNVLARELEAESEAAQAAASEAVTGSSPTGGAKRQRSETNNTGSPVVDTAMTGGESGGDSDGGAAAMDVVEPQPPAAKRGRRNQERQSASPPTAVAYKNGNGDNAQGRVLRSRGAASAAGGRH